MNITLFSYPVVIHKNYNCSDDRKLCSDVTSPPLCYKIMGQALNRDLHLTDKCH